MSGDEVFDFEELIGVVSGEWDRGSILAKIYEPARRSVWSALRSHALPQELAERRDALERLIALMQRKAPVASVSVQHQIGALRDLLNDTLVFQIQHPSIELRSKPHVISLLKIIQHTAGKISRKQLLLDSELKEANLSRLLGLIEGAGLVRRGRSSDGVCVEILPLGMQMVVEEERAQAFEEAKPETATPDRVSALPPSPGIAAPTMRVLERPVQSPRERPLRINMDIDGTKNRWATPHATSEIHV